MMSFASLAVSLSPQMCIFVRFSCFTSRLFVFIQETLPEALSIRLSGLRQR